MHIFTVAPQAAVVAHLSLNTAHCTRSTRRWKHL